MNNDKDDIQLIFNFAGYQNNSDITAVPPNFLVPPSQNVLITGDTTKVIESRSGYTLLGRPSTQPLGFGGIRSKYDNFVNAVGIKLPIREYPDSTGQVIYEVFYNHPITNVSDWHRIYGVYSDSHESYFTEWYDDDLSVPKLVWVNGTNLVNSWNGGISPVVSFTANTVTVVDDPAQFGFGNLWNKFSINGVVFDFTGISGNTFTGVTPNPITSGVAANDVLIQQAKDEQLLYLNTQLTNVPTLDICGTLDNHIFYGSYHTRVGYISNSQSQIAIQEKTTSNSVLDDIVITGSYVNTVPLNDIKIEIVSIAPPVEIQEYIYTGNGINDGVYDTSGYSGTPGVENIYRTVVVATFTLVFGNGSGYSDGEVVIGSTSGAEARVVDTAVVGLNDEVAVIVLSGVFQAGETVVGQTSGASNASTNATFQDWIQFYANDVLQTITNGPYTGTTVALFSTAVITLTDGLVITFGNWYGHALGDTFKLTIVAGKPDQYKWSVLDPATGNFINPQGPFDINTAGSPLTDATVFPGVSISWQSATDGNPYGHAVGDFWTIHFENQIDKPWIDTFFSTPLRKPGQGGLIKLDSPPVFFKVTEEELHANSRSGIIFVFKFALSADLQHETIIANRIKTDISNKSLRQALTVNTKNDIFYINVENQLVSLGRIENINNVPMMEVISLPIKNDFFQSKFIISKNGVGNGHVDWADNKVFVCIPSEGKWWIYDQFYEYWQAPQTGSFSAISVINGQVCAHSAITDETYVLFNSANDNGYPFKALAAFPYYSAGRRDRLKAVSELFTEGYKSENTNLYAKVNLEYGNCERGPDERLDPKICTPESKASLGKANFGKHGLANDPIQGLNKFHHVLPFNEKFVYEYQVIYYSDSIDLYFKIVSTGINAMQQDQRNVSILKPAGTVESPQYPGIPGTPKLSPEIGGTNLPDSVALGILNGNGN